MRRHVLDVDGHDVPLDSVKHTPLLVETKRAQMREAPREFFVVKGLDGPQTLWTGLPDDGAPEGVLFSHLMGKLVERLRGVARFHNEPYTSYSIYVLEYASRYLLKFVLQLRTLLR